MFLVPAVVDVLSRIKKTLRFKRPKVSIRITRTPGAIAEEKCIRELAVDAIAQARIRQAVHGRMARRLRRLRNQPWTVA